LFIGSHLGDSQLVKIHTSPIADFSTPTLPIPDDVLFVQLGSFLTSSKGKGRAATTDGEGEGRVLGLNGTFIEVLDTWQNVGPILDAVLADTDGSGQVILILLISFDPLLRIIPVAAYLDCLGGHEHGQPTYYPERCKFQKHCRHREHEKL
jgi:hypothetical protein